MLPSVLYGYYNCAFHMLPSVCMVIAFAHSICFLVFRMIYCSCAFHMFLSVPYGILQLRIPYVAKCLYGYCSCAFDMLPSVPYGYCSCAFHMLELIRYDKIKFIAKIHVSVFTERVYNYKLMII